VRLLGRQISSHNDLALPLPDFTPDAAGFGLNCLANEPEVIRLGAAGEAGPARHPSRSASAGYRVLEAGDA
jgi:hypothetical protein